MDTSKTVRRNKTSARRPADEVSRTGAAATGRNWALAVAATICLATIVGFAYGWPASAAVAFLTSIAGVAKGCIELQQVVEKRGLEEPPNPRQDRRFGIGVVAALIIGVAIGFLLLPWVVGIFQGPSASLTIPASVDAIQPVTVSWRNIAPTDDLRVLVRAKGNDVNFILPCSAQGTRRGKMSCEAGIGGLDDRGRLFEVRIIRMPHRLSEQFNAATAEVFYPASTPGNLQVIDSVVVTRN